MAQPRKRSLIKKVSLISIIFLNAGIFSAPIKAVRSQGGSISPNSSEPLAAPSNSTSRNSDSCSSQNTTSTTSLCTSESHSTNNSIEETSKPSSGSYINPTDSKFDNTTEGSSPSAGVIKPDSNKPESNSTLLKPTNNPFDSRTDGNTSTNIPQSNGADSSTADQSKPTTDSSVQPNNISSPPGINGEEPAPQSSAERKEELSIEKNIADKINQYREEKGLKPLKLDSDISKSAQAHSLEMAEKEVPVGHQGFKTRVKMLKEEFNLKSAAENIAYNQGYKDPATRALDGWLESPGHKKNIEGNYNLTGIGVAKDKEGKTFLTQIFVSGSKINRQTEPTSDTSDTSEKTSTEPVNTNSGEQDSGE